MLQHSGERPQSPVRGSKEQSRRASVDTVLSTATEEEEEEPRPEIQEKPAEPTKRVDITVHISDSLVNELSDKNWKVGLVSLQICNFKLIFLVCYTRDVLKVSSFCMKCRYSVAIIVLRMRCSIIVVLQSS